MNQRNQSDRRGFTLAEVLIVLALVVLLTAVIGVSVARYQRSMHQLEMDGHAKEILIAAQNHLTAAKSQGYLGYGADAFGTRLDKDLAATLYPDGAGTTYDDIYYFVAGSGAGSTAFGDHATLLDEMLPVSAVDDTLRLGGSFVVVYQQSSAVVLDVFFNTPSGTRFGCDFTLAEVVSAAGGTGLLNAYRFSAAHDARARYGVGRAAIGWYGGADPLALPAASELVAPGLRLFNREQLWAVVLPENTDSVDGYGYSTTGAFALTLEVRGVDSGKTVTFSLNDGDASRSARVEWVSYESAVPEDQREDAYSGTWCYRIILDDITASALRFQNLEGLVPGEDIRVTASLTPTPADGPALAPLSSETLRTNSLFAYNPADDALSVQTAKIAYMRHLENLDPAVSDFAFAPYTDGNGLVNADQIADLSWDWYGSGGRSVFHSGGATEAGYYYPVSPAYDLDYDGGRHSVTGVAINEAHGGAGLFGALSDSSVSSLKLVDFSVSGGSADAGALAGSLTDCSVTDVVAYGSSAAAGVTGSGNAGGLIGAVSGKSDVSKSAAALPVNAGTGGTAGGLIGVTGPEVTVTGSYAGGRTLSGSYQAWIDSGKPYDVTGAVAGGLIGAADAAAVTNCYSTCSVSGAAAGGLLGTASGTITDCYATGLLAASDVGGAFAGSFTGTADGCRYYEIINERYDDLTKAMVTLGPVGAGAYTGAVTALDADLAAYNAFVGDPDDWRSASAFDSSLYTCYQGHYSLGALTQLGAVSESDLAAVHYGDWPAPELWAINK